MNKWLYKKIVRVSSVSDEVAALSERGLACEVKHVSTRRARRRGGRPVEIREVQVRSVAKDEWLSGRGYLPVVRSMGSRGFPTQSRAVSDLPRAQANTPPSDPNLIRELRENESLCREIRGHLPRHRTQRIGSGIRKGQRKGAAIDVVGTCTLCLKEVPQRWRFASGGLSGRPIFLCGMCIQQLRNKKATGGDAMSKAVYRRRSRG